MSKLKELNFIVMLPIMFAVLALIILSAVNADAFGTFVEGAAHFICSKVGWSFGSITLILIVFLIGLMFHPISKTKIGGEMAQPEFKNFSWWAMIVCSSIAIGIVFWGVAEPMYHYATPQPSSGIEAFSDEALINALSQSHVHYAFGQYCYYTFFGILIALAIYNFKQPRAISSAFFFIKNKPLSNGWRNVVDLCCILGCVAGVTYSLGCGVMQIGSGLESVFGIDPTYLVWLIIAIGVVFFFTFSSYLGVSKGMKHISDINVYIFIICAAFVLLVGPTMWLFNIGQEAIGDYIMKIIPKTLFTGGPSEDDWGVSWTLFMFASVVGVAPTVGLFQARISKGRTIRELIFGFWFIPSAFNIVWFTIFGGTGMYMQKNGQFDLWGAMEKLGLESSIFQFYQNMPLGAIVTVIFLICVIFSFVTFADANIGCIALMSLKDIEAVGSDKEAPAYLKFIWGILIGFTSLAFITFGGIFAVRRVPILAAMPLFVITAILIVMACKLFFSKKNVYITETTKLLGEDNADVVPEDGIETQEA